MGSIMSWQDAFNIAFAILMALGSAIGVMLWNMIRSTQNEVRDFITQYVRKDDYRSDVQELRTLIYKVLERLDHKADKG